MSDHQLLPGATHTLLGRRLARRAFLRLSAASGLGLAAGAGLASRVAGQSPAAPGPDLSGVTIDLITLSGEDGEKELAAWREEQGVSLAITPNAGWDDTFAKLTTDTFDIALVANPYVSLWGQAGAIRPLDLNRISNWPDVFPALREGDFLRDEAGNVYAVPIAWGDGPYVYAPDRVDTPPTTITDLLDPAWAQRIVTFDDPILIFHQLAVAKGYPSPNMTRDQLADIQEDARTIVGNLRAFATTYEDATDYLVRGEADLSLGGWEAMLNWAADDGITLDFAFLEESHGGGWCDSFAIPTNAVDVDAAYAYIDAIIAPEVNAQVATNLISGTVNSRSVDLVAPEAQIYDYSIVETTTDPIKFEAWTPPLEAEGDIATKQDWDDAWAQIRAGA
jgi:spermidine/putrescine transport system substrate-binding protein